MARPGTMEDLIVNLTPVAGEDGKPYTRAAHALYMLAEFKHGIQLPGRFSLDYTTAQVDNYVNHYEKTFPDCPAIALARGDKVPTDEDQRAMLDWLKGKRDESGN